MSRFFLPNFTFKWALNAIVFLAATGGVAAWSATAFRIHLSGGVLTAALVALGIGVLGALGAAVSSRGRGWLALLLVAGLSIGWYNTLQPKADGDWAFDVAHGASARIEGSTVQMANVRNFNWTSIDTADEAWETRSYDLDKLASVDLVTSVWDNPDIAHIIVTFGFTDGERVAFSVETRREETEAWSVLGGFFRQFELVLIAATEDDILKLRTNHRQEDVRLYPLALSEAQMRALFLEYVDLAQKLEQDPAFYNTITHNCTTTLYPLANAVHPELKLDWRLVMSGHLPGYIAELGGLTGEMPINERIAQAAITQAAMASGTVSYSDAIRAAYTVK